MRGDTWKRRRSGFSRTAQWIPDITTRLAPRSPRCAPMPAGSRFLRQARGVVTLGKPCPTMTRERRLRAARHAWNGRPISAMDGDGPHEQIESGDNEAPFLGNPVADKILRSRPDRNGEDRSEPLSRNRTAPVSRDRSRVSASGQALQDEFVRKTGALIACRILRQ